MATWNWCLCSGSDRQPELLRSRIRLVDLGKSSQAERENSPAAVRATALEARAVKPLEEIQEEAVA